MTTGRTRTFKSGNSEAVRLPKGSGYGVGVELIYVRSGDVTTLYPAPQKTIAQVLSELRALPKAPIEERDTDEIPERPGL